MAIDIDKAKLLRSEGKTLQEVADTMGCSLAWCKANLKGTKQANKDLALIEQVRHMGRSVQGVTTGEIKMLTTGHYPNMIGEELETKTEAIRKAARRNNPDVVIRPYWMLPDCPRECTLAMIEAADEVWRFKEYLADKYRKDFDLDETYARTIVHALTMLSAGENNKLMPQGLLAYGAHLERIQEQLDSRNNPQYVAQTTTEPYIVEDMPEFIDFNDYEEIDFLDLGT
jgi:hypothetical protein